MLKNATQAEKFKMIQNWIPTIIGDIKKDLKNEHLKKDPRFIKKYFSNKNLSRLTNEELAEGYTQALATEEAAETLAEYISNRWLLKHSDIYNYFEQKLQEISPDFTAIEVIEKNKALALMEDSIKHHGAPNTYLFSVINSVVFPADVLETLKKRAQDSKKHAEEEAVQNNAKLSLDNIHTTYKEQIARLTDKYEKKIAGLERKYHNDMESFKKQIAILQKKLNGQ